MSVSSFQQWAVDESRSSLGDPLAAHFLNLSGPASRCICFCQVLHYSVAILCTYLRTVPYLPVFIALPLAFIEKLIAL